MVYGNCHARFNHKHGAHRLANLKARAASKAIFWGRRCENWFSNHPMCVRWQFPVDKGKRLAHP